ncbi:MAG TPA: M56 family metallopeptidase [Arenimonas sp.]|uniref:M56 family metallopeptidase n=1 Tax=Arenimonas sp. TaxID=1872635 RepID=UPI002D7E4625|nr:M56 family metallopeptidase [Arenimonas sp.]HEU0153998.1 M56 family metallopeptidase [Arenimonas sp.]
MSVIDALVSFQLTLLLHATVLLSLVWGLERSGALRHPGWAELAWRAALFGALLSATLSVLGPALDRAAGTTGPRAATAAPPPAEDAGRGAPSTAAVVQAPVPGEAGLPRATRRAAAARPDAPATTASTTHSTTVSSSTTFAAEAPDGLALPLAAVLVLLLPWALGLAVAGVRLGAQWRHLRRWSRALAATPTQPAAPVLEQAASVARELALPRPPTLHALAGLGSPMLLPGGRLLLPDWVEGLGRPQQRALLAHEFTHLQRHDPAWRLAQRLALVPLFVHPLAWLALRRLEALAEDACDARAAELCGSGRPLAECLATCLTHAGRRAGHSPLAVAMADDSGQVVRRVQNLLEEAPMTRPIPTALRRTVLVAALAAAVALPGLAVTSIGNDAFAGSLFSWGEGTAHTQSNNRDTYQYRNSATGERIKLTIKGGVTFNAGESDILAMDPDAEFKLDDTRSGTQRKLEVSLVDGQLVRDYRVDGDTQPFDAVARAWLAERLPYLMRETGMQAEARGKRILAAGGPTALLAEIDLIRGDYARRRYLEVLFGNATLDDTQMGRALDLARGLDSDYELRQALSAGLASQALSPARQVQLLALAGDIGSDYEQAQLLAELAERQAITGPVLPAWRQVLDDIGSDYEQRRVLEALLATGEPDAARLALDGARTISSDYEARQVLLGAVAQARKDAGIRAAWFDVLAGIGSDYEQRQALEALVTAGPVDAPLAEAVLASLDHVGSGYETSVALRLLAAHMPNDPALIERYRTVARGLADHERGQAEKALDRFASR